MSDNAKSKSIPVSELGVVLYTDGSARPNPGFIGSGVYGYTYHADKEVVNTTVTGIHYYSTHGWLDTAKQKIDAYKNILPVEPIEILEFVGSYAKTGTNNLAEILALSEMLALLTENKEAPKVIRVLADSEYVKKGITEWCSGWVRNNWLKRDGQPVANMEEWKRLYSLVLDYKARGGILEIFWVKGHNDVFGNTHADYLAGVGMLRSRHSEPMSQLTRLPYKEAFKTVHERNPLVCHRRVYFNSDPELNEPGTYYQGDPGVKEEHVAGKRTPDAAFSVVKLKDPCPVMETVKEQQYRACNQQSAIIVMRLERVYHRDVQPYLERYGRHSLMRSHKSFNLELPIDGKPVTLEMNPPGLTLRVIEAISSLELVLDNYLHQRNLGTEGIGGTMSYDITDRFFTQPDVEAGKKKKTAHVLRDDFTNQVKVMEIDLVYHTGDREVPLMIPLVIGIDTLPRNNLKKLEPHHPKVTLITWRTSVNSIQYATIVECDLGCGVWSNFHSDRIFIKSKAGGHHAKQS